MKIAVIAYHYSESTLSLSKYLSLQGHDVDYYFINFLGKKTIPGIDFNASEKPGLHLLVPTEAPEAYKYLRGTKVNIYLIRLLRDSKRFFFLNRIIVKNVCKKINDNYYDVINLVGQNDLLISFHQYLEKFKRIHTVHEVSNHFAQTGLNSRLLNYLFDKSIHIIVHSNNSYETIIRYSNCSRELVSTIPFGLFECYNSFSSKNSVTKQENIILFYGIIMPYKGLDILIEAIKILKTQTDNFSVIIAGSGFVPELKHIIGDRTYTLINRPLSNYEIAHLNQIAKVVVCPYKSASQSGIVMTTFQFNKPVIASNVGAFKEVIEDNFNGFLVNPQVPSELASTIFKILNDEQLYNRLKLGILKLKDSEFCNWNNIALRTAEVFSAI